MISLAVGMWMTDGAGVGAGGKAFGPAPWDSISQAIAPAITPITYEGLVRTIEFVG